MKKCDIDDSFSNTFRIGGVKYPLVEYYKKESLRKYGIYDFESKKVLFETTEWIGRDIIDDYIFSDINNIIVCRKIGTGETIWENDLKVISKSKSVVKFITLNNSKLYVSLDLESKTIVSLDINNGSVINIWSDIHTL